jgi:hypothetical protein
MPSLQHKLEASYLRSRRAVFHDLIFFLVCLVAAIVLRRLLSYPPMLSWVVFAVPAVVFAGDFARLLYYRMKLARFRPEQNSS